MGILIGNQCRPAATKPVRPGNGLPTQTSSHLDLHHVVFRRTGSGGGGGGGGGGGRGVTRSILCLLVVGGRVLLNRYRALCRLALSREKSAGRVSTRVQHRFNYPAAWRARRGEASESTEFEECAVTFSSSVSGSSPSLPCSCKKKKRCRRMNCCVSFSLGSRFD